MPFCPIKKQSTNLFFSLHIFFFTCSRYNSPTLLLLRVGLVIYMFSALGAVCSFEVLYAGTHDLCVFLFFLTELWDVFRGSRGRHSGAVSEDGMRTTPGSIQFHSLPPSLPNPERNACLLSSAPLTVPTSQCHNMPKSPPTYNPRHSPESTSLLYILPHTIRSISITLNVVGCSYWSFCFQCLDVSNL